VLAGMIADRELRSGVRKRSTGVQRSGRRNKRDLIPFLLAGCGRTRGVMKRTDCIPTGGTARDKVEAICMKALAPHWWEE